MKKHEELLSFIGSSAGGQQEGEQIDGKRRKQGEGRNEARE